MTKPTPKTKLKPKVDHRTPAQVHQPDGHITRVFIDPRTGHTYPTRRLLRQALGNWQKRVLADFERLVAERTLGQPAWEQLPGEPPVAYSRFRSYLTMALNHKGERSLAVLSSLIAARKTELERSSSRFHWVLRAKLWDQWLVEQEDVEFARERKRSAGRQARLGMRLQSAASKGLQHLAENPDRLAAMTPMEILKMSEAGQRVERLAHGDATVVTDGKVQLVWDGPKPTWAPEQQSDSEPLPLTDGKTIEGRH